MSRALHMKMRFVILTPAKVDPNLTHGTERVVTRSVVMVSNMIVSPSTILVAGVTQSTDSEY